MNSVRSLPPEYLLDELDEANKAIREAGEHYNGVQHRIALWHCSEGRHVFCTYHNPPIGRACMHCRAPETEGIQTGDGSR